MPGSDERLQPRSRILTLDSDFRVYRRNRRQPFRPSCPVAKAAANSSPEAAPGRHLAAITLQIASIRSGESPQSPSGGAVVPIADRGRIPRGSVQSGHRATGRRDRQRWYAWRCRRGAAVRERRVMPARSCRSPIDLFKTGRSIRHSSALGDFTSEVRIGFRVHRSSGAPILAR